MIHIGVVAGELSGDILAGGLLNELKHSQLTEKAAARTLHFSGITGPNMRQAGCQSIATIDQLSVMGIFEVLLALPRIYFGVYRRIVRHFLTYRPDLFIGIDSPDFNLRLAGKLKKQGIKTVQYVSPTLWAWRESRIKTVKKNIDHMLVILPFEQDFYERHGVASTYVGHPMADQFSLEAEDCEIYQKKLGLSPDKSYIALLPGSRMGEVKALLTDFLETARLCKKKKPDLEFLVPAAHPHIKQYIQRQLDEDLSVHVFDGQAHDVIRASQGVLTASGTATLEIMLLKRPMVVAYRLANMTYRLAKRLVTARHFSLPNLLAGETIVPEYIQHAIDPLAMSHDLLFMLDDNGHRKGLLEQFTVLHKVLSRHTDVTAATQIRALL